MEFAAKGHGMKRLCVYAVAVTCAVVAPMAIAGRAAQDNTATPDISGFWELNFDSRQVPRVSLLPSITRAKIDARAKGDAYARRWCNLLGVPFVMDPWRALDIRQGATAVIIVPENASAPRYLYTNRAAHISEDILDPSTNGDSVARWEGDTLVVDTIGFHGQRGITAIPGGGSPAAGDTDTRTSAAPRVCGTRFAGSPMPREPGTSNQEPMRSGLR
jgi:hypothetical protein